MNAYSKLLNSEILDGIEEIRQNQFIAEMNVMNSMMDYYNKQAEFIEHCNPETCDIDEVFVESSNETSESGSDKPKKKKGGKLLNFLKNIGKAIIDFFKMIGHGIKNLAENIKRFFTKKKKTMDQMCEEAGIPEAGSASDMEDTTIQEGFLDAFKKQGKSQNDHAPKQKEPFDDPEFNNFKFRFVNRGEVEIEYKQIFVDDKSIPGHKNTMNKDTFANVYALITDPDVLKIYEEFVYKMEVFMRQTLTNAHEFKSIKDKENTAKEIFDKVHDSNAPLAEREKSTDALRAARSERKEYQKQVRSKSDDLLDCCRRISDIVAKYKDSEKMKVNVDRLMETSGRYYKLSSRMSEIFNSQYSDMGVLEDMSAVLGPKKSWAYAINEMRNKLNTTSMAISVLCRQINNATVYVSSNYARRATKVTQLSKFVDLMLKQGVPPRNINEAIMKVCHPKMLGEDPKSGMSRLILFPTTSDGKDKVIKVAYNAFGIAANKNEAKFYQYITRSKDPEISEGKDYFAAVRGVTKEQTAIIMERVTPLEDFAEISQTRTKIRNWLKKTSKDGRNPFDLEDLNAGGFGKTVDGRPVCLDYGWAVINDGAIKFRLEF